MKNLFIPMIVLCLLLCIQPVMAQSQSDSSKAPQILTSDLVRKQLIQEDTLAVSFVFVDDDDITEISINGKPETITPGKSIVVNKKFVFKPGKTLIKVSATDAAGNRREKSFLVAYKLGEGQQFEADDQEKKPDYFWKAVFGAALETDDNPSNDLSLPISVGDLKITGVIPDSEQPDQRTTLKGTLIGGYKSFTAYAGISQTKYSKAENEYLGSLATYFGGGYTYSFSKTRKFVVNFLWLDINIGGEDYSQNIGITPGFQFLSQDEEGSYKHIWSIDLMTKDFADPNLSTGSQSVLKWAYDSVDAEKLDRYHRTFAIGTNNNGTDESDCSFYSFDYDWYNRWEAGFKWDLGFGFQYRNYKNEVPLSSDTGLGTSRVDFPIRISTGMGWQFKPDWNLMYNYKYTFNLSNKSPYVRTIQGLTFNGAF